MKPLLKETDQFIRLPIGVDFRTPEHICPLFGAAKWKAEGHQQYADFCDKLASRDVSELFE